MVSDEKGRLTRVWVVNIRVRSMAKAIEFYRDVVGWPVQLHSREYGWVELGPTKESTMISLVEVGGDELEVFVKEGERSSGITFDTDDLDALCARLKKQGVKIIVEPTVMPWKGRMAAFVDPDGNKLVVVEDPMHYQRGW